MNTIRPFTISIPDSQLDLLHQKLQAATFPDELDAAGWDLGVPLDEIKRLTAYWRDGFDWRAKEKELNGKLHQFMVSVSVSGFVQLDIHCVHQRSPMPGAIPLLFLHGWPGSFLEAVKLIPLLTKGDENQPAFDLVVPSLPNFGFSQGVKQRGFGLAQYAEAMHSLMLNLGYEKYGTLSMTIHPFVSISRPPVDKSKSSKEETGVASSPASWQRSTPSTSKPSISTSPPWLLPTHGATHGSLCNQF